MSGRLRQFADMSQMEWIMAVGGLVAGVFCGWILRAFRRDSGERRVEAELRDQLKARESELARERINVSEALTGRAAAEAGRQAAEALSSQHSQALASAERGESSLREELRTLTAALAAARAEVDAGRALLEDQRRLQAANERQWREHQDRAMADLRSAHDRALTTVRDQFKALAAEALAANSPAFLRLASESLAKFQTAAEGDLAQRQAGIATLVKPLEEQLQQYQQRLQQAEAQQQATLGQVRQHLETLASQSHSLAHETQRLRVVLSSSQARGRWGEETLRRIVEAAQLSPHCDFTEQMRVGDAKPDLVVHLPGDRSLLVDSKVPDLEFLDALGGADEAKRATALAAHARKLRETIRSLAERDYPAQFRQALDYVVLFLPAESLLSAALEGDRDLILWAAQHRVLLATPASLIALLRCVAVSWQQQEQSQNAREIAEAARQLYERVTRFTEHLDSIREGLSRANRAYDAAVGSYERSVRPSGERFMKLGGTSSDKVLTPLPPLEATLRSAPRVDPVVAVPPAPEDSLPTESEKPAAGETPAAGNQQVTCES